MSVVRMSAGRARALRDATPTADVHALRKDATPDGFARLRCDRVLARRDFERAAADLLGWRVHARAGLHVATSDESARLGTVVLMRFGVGPVGLSVPCRVVEIVEEGDRRGFAYVTLPGHPECGVEWFVIHRSDDGTLRFAVTAVSRPASLLARLAGPLGRALQHRMTRHYLRALDQLG